MREVLERLVHDVTLVTVALAIALGWSLYQVAHGVGQLVTALFTDYEGEALTVARDFEPLTWEVGGRILTLGPLVAGVAEFVVVLAVAALLYRRLSRSPST
jgi:hypothetical protein